MAFVRGLEEQMGSYTLSRTLIEIWRLTLFREAHWNKGLQYYFTSLYVVFAWVCSGRPRASRHHEQESWPCRRPQYRVE